MATRPTSPTRFADTTSDRRTAITTGLRDKGWKPGDEVDAGTQNQREYEVGEWLGYLADLSPSDDVLAFREWECLDDDTYDVKWSTGTDGLLTATLDSLDIDTNGAWNIANVLTSNASVSSDAAGTVSLQTAYAGQLARIAAFDNATGTESAVVSVQEATRNISIVSTDGDIDLDAGGGDITMSGDIDLTGSITASDSATVDKDGGYLYDAFTEVGQFFQLAGRNYFNDTNVTLLEAASGCVMSNAGGGGESAWFLLGPLRDSTNPTPGTAGERVTSTLAAFRVSYTGLGSGDTATVTLYRRYQDGTGGVTSDVIASVSLDESVDGAAGRKTGTVSAANMLAGCDYAVEVELSASGAINPNGVEVDIRRTAVE